MVTGVRTVYVVIGCDVDPDRERLLDGIPTGQLTWRGATEGIPTLKAAVRGVSDAAGHDPAFTWFLRADEQVRAVHGDYGWFARTQGPLLRTLKASGDELAWHPHFWRRDGASGPWFQEVEDLAWQVDMLRRAHRDLSAALTVPPRSVRMGWSYHNNDTCAALADLGITVDYSAIPGLRTLNPDPPRRSENLFDWYPTPRAPYHPSRADYRRAARNGEPALGLLEVPCFVSSSLGWALVAGAQMFRKTRDAGHVWRAMRRPTYCINVTARPRYFAPLVSQLLRELRRGGQGPLVFETHFHADEVVPNRSSLYDLASVRANLEAIRTACHEARTPLEFVTADRIPALVEPR